MGGARYEASVRQSSYKAETLPVLDDLTSFCIPRLIFLQGSNVNSTIMKQFSYTACIACGRQKSAESSELSELPEPDGNYISFLIHHMCLHDSTYDRLEPQEIDARLGHYYQSLRASKETAHGPKTFIHHYNSKQIIGVETSIFCIKCWANSIERGLERLLRKLEQQEKERN